MKKNIIILLFGWIMCIAVVAVATVAIYNGIHRHRYEEEVTDPTCTERGYTTYTCECGSSYKDNYIDARGHNYIDGKCGICGYEHSHEYEKEVTAPTCKDKGYTTYSCICGVSYTADETDIVDHNYVNGKCSMCGIEHAHEYEKAEIEPTCTASGFTTYTCTCGLSYKSGYTEPLGHSFVDGTCGRCGLETVKVESVALSKMTFTVKKGNGGTLSATVLPADAYDKSVIWTSSDESVVTVEDGVITAVDYGTATVTVTTVDGNKTAKCKVTVGEFAFTEIVEDGEVVGYSVEAIKTLLDAEVTIPDSYKGKPVTTVGLNAFADCSVITNVTIPESVTTIRIGAFSYCENLTAVNIPASVTTIETYAFRGCGGLVSITVDEGNTNYYSQGNCLIEDKSNTLILGCKNSEIPDSVTAIGHSAFLSCKELAILSIPDSVTSIGMSAFRSCTNLRLIIFRGSWNSWHNVEKGDQWDYNMSYTVSCEGDMEELIYKLSEDETYYICSGITDKNVRYIKIRSEFEGKPVKAIGASAFKDCLNVTDVLIPDGVTSIGDLAFRGCSKLISVTVPDSITSIGNWAFYDCSSLQSITIPYGVTAIGDYAFYGCSGLTGITLPETVTSIGSRAFGGCSRLTSIIVPASVTSIFAGAFSSCCLLVNLKVAEGNTKFHSDGNCIIETASKTLIVGCNKSVIPDNVTTIGMDAFYGCSSLTSITIPDNVTYIGSSAFCGCSSLTSVTIPDRVTTISSYAFKGCSSLTSVTMPVSVTKIGYSAFEGCSSLTSITIPDNATYIDGMAFRYCSGLTSITIPAYVTYIDTSAFSSCNNLVNLKVDKGNSKYHSSGNCIIETASKTLIAGCKTSVIPDDGSVTSIGSWAFCGCSDLVTINIPVSVTSIGGYAFYNCRSLKSITYEGTQEQWRLISKDSFWDYFTASYTIYCTDADIKKY